MKSFKSFLTRIRRYKRFLITTHQSPDADAIASALLIRLLLKAKGKTAVVAIDGECPYWLKFLPTQDSLKAPNQLRTFDYEAAIVVDCGDLRRIGQVMKLIKKDKPIVNIDHHVTNTYFGCVNVVWPKASSCCEMIFCLLKEARHPLNGLMAQLLYAGIMTDTGSFRYENTTAFCHQIVSQLMAYNISASHMYNRLYVGIPVRDIKYFTRVVHRARFLYDHKVCCLILPKKQEAMFSKSFDLKERLFGFLRSLEGIEVTVIVTQLGPKESRVNMRSHGDVDVARICQRFNGGGHVKAAGCKINLPLAAVQKMVCGAIRQQL